MEGGRVALAEWIRTDLGLMLGVGGMVDSGTVVVVVVVEETWSLDEGG
jgi:hypothetical protein